MRSHFLPRFLMIGLTCVMFTCGVATSTKAASIDPPPGSGAPGSTVGGGSRP